jgi:hypothetical protein
MSKTKSTVVEIRQLRLALNRILDHVCDARGITSVSLAQDYYWAIPTASVYSVTEQLTANDFEIGSLCDDWDIIQTCVIHTNNAIAANLATLAPLLRYIGERLGEELATVGG